MKWLNEYIYSRGCSKLKVVIWCCICNKMLSLNESTVCLQCTEIKWKLSFFGAELFHFWHSRNCFLTCLQTLVYMDMLIANWFYTSAQKVFLTAFVLFFFCFFSHILKLLSLQWMIYMYRKRLSKCGCDRTLKVLWFSSNLFNLS